METKLISLVMTNFKGIENMAVNFDGQNVDISGPNGCGKTTIADAYLWLIGGMSYADGRKLDEDIKRKDVDGNAAVDGGVEHSVEMTLSIDGVEKTYKKVYAEKWSKKRGLANKEMSGHTTTYFINGMSATKGVYDKDLQAIHADVLAMVARPQTFSEMDTKKKRAMLIDILGGQTVPTEYPEAVKKYIDTYGDLNGALDAVNHDLSAVNKQLDEIPVRIDEATKNVPPEVDTVGIDCKLEKLRAQRKELDQYVNGLWQNDKGVELRNKEKALCAEIELLQKKINDAVVHDIQHDKITLQEQHRKVFMFENDVKALSRKIEDERKHNAQLVQNWKIAMGTTPEVVDVCPTCGQKIPPEKIKEAIAKFNQDKAEHLKQIGKKGKQSKAYLDDLLADLHTCQEKLKEEQRIEAELNARDSKACAYQSLLVKEWQQQISELNAQKLEFTKACQDSPDDGQTEELVKVNMEISKIDEQIKGLIALQAQVGLRTSTLFRIDELKQEQKACASRYDDLIEIKQQMEGVIKKIVDDMHTKIAEKFQYAKFCMYKKQVNGGIAECCEVLNKDGVPLATSANMASRILANMDIARVIGEHYDVHAPMFVDNGESVIELPVFKGIQTIALSVKGIGSIAIEPLTDNDSAENISIQ